MLLHEAAAKLQRKFEVQEGSKAPLDDSFPRMGNFPPQQEFDPPMSTTQALTLVHFGPHVLNGRGHSSRNPTDFPDFACLSP
jgi:hypothetical protein